MSVTTLSAHARAICYGAAVECRYELDARRFRWNFYRDGAKVAGTQHPHRVIELARKIIVDVGLITNLR